MNDVFQTVEQLPWTILLSLLCQMASDPFGFVGTSVNNSWLPTRLPHLILGSNKSHGILPLWIVNQ